MKVLTQFKIFPAMLAAITVLTIASGVSAQEQLRLVRAAINQSGPANQPGPTFIPSGSKLYVFCIAGLPEFEHHLVAALQKKRVDLVVVADRSLADFEVTGFAHSHPAGWARTIFGSGLPESEASIQLINLRTGVVAYAVASYKVDALNGNKSTAEHLAKNLRQKMERDEKRLRK